MSSETLPEIVDQKGGLPAITYTPDQVALIKRMYAKDATDDELAAFMYAAKRLKLDIIARQIHFTKRQGKPVFIVAIDGYRLNAERTKQYAPGREPSFTYDDKGGVVSATAYVKKFIGGEWHETAATAFMDEYKPSDESAAFMWRKMPHNQLAKCAEALALRRAFPNELGDTITEEEAAQTREPDGKEPIKPAQPKSAPSDGEAYEFVPSDFDTKSGEKNGKTWVKYGVQDAAGKWFSTFDEKLAEILSAACENKKAVRISYTTDGKFNTIKGAALAD